MSACGLIGFLIVSVVFSLDGCSSKKEGVIQVDHEYWPVIESARDSFWIISFNSDKCTHCKGFNSIFNSLWEASREIPNLKFGRVYCPSKLSLKKGGNKKDLEALVDYSQSYGEIFYSDFVEGSIRSARLILPTVVNLVKPQSVCDVGCGTGVWLKVCQEIVGMSDADAVGFDFGVPVKSLFIEQSQYRNVDLSKPLLAERKYDLCISVEVAEHISAKNANTFVESLVSLAPVVLFSAAIPGQGGDHHINEQWPVYWEEKFKKHNYYAVDCLRSKFWNHDRIAWWYRQNIVFFVKEEELPLFGFTPMKEPLMSLVHPDDPGSERWKDKVKEKKKGWRRGRSKMCTVYETYGMLAIKLFHEGSSVSYSGAHDLSSLTKWLSERMIKDKTNTTTLTSDESEHCFDPYYPRVVWSYWDDEVTIPEDVEEMIDVTRNSLGNFTYIFLTDKNLSHYIDVLSLPSFYTKLTAQHRGDYLRIILLEKFGGVYVDCSTYVTSGEAMEWFFSEALISQREVFGFGDRRTNVWQNLYGACPYSLLLSKFKEELDQILSGDAYDYCKKVVLAGKFEKKNNFGNSGNYECFTVLFSKFAKKNRSLENTIHLLCPRKHIMSNYRLIYECNENADCVKDRLLHDLSIRSHAFIKLHHKYRVGKKLNFFQK